MSTRDGRRKGRRGGGGDRAMVPPAEFTSYYGRPIVKPAPWEYDIPAYLFSGGLAAGSSLLAAGADLTGRPALRRSGRVTALGALGVSMVALVHDLGKPSRFLNMLRTVKLTSPMSVGTWILSIYGPFAGAAAAAEVVDMLPAGARRGPLRLLSAVGRPAGVVGALTAPPVAAYTAVLLADTATPSWHAAFKELPFVFVGSAAAASGGFGMLAAPVAEAGPARRSRTRTACSAFSTLPRLRAARWRSIARKRKLSSRRSGSRSSSASIGPARHTAARDTASAKVAIQVCGFTRRAERSFRSMLPSPLTTG